MTIHTPCDGRGLRKVTVNGKVINHVMIADTRRGIVVHTDTPARVHKYGKRLITRTKRGKVEVTQIL